FKTMMRTGLTSLLVGCASDRFSMVESPVTVQGRPAVYLETSKGECYLKVPQSSGSELRIYDWECDGAADAVGEANITENFLYLQNRETLDWKSQIYIDGLLGEAKRSKMIGKEPYVNNTWPQDLLR
ncbi:MAG: hypothetical protein AABX05_00965, partial [Nanoarchaeota archaeon]